MNVAAPLSPVKTPDKLFVFMLVGAAVAGMALSLASAGYLLAFNVQTLMVSTIIFSVTGVKYILNAKPVMEQVKWASLAVVPILLRIVLNMSFFNSYAGSMVDVVAQLLFTLQVVGLWLLVAVCEESFRATMATVWEAICRFKNRRVNVGLQLLFADALWILFHFIQRPFDPFAYRYYIVWLFVAGLVMGYAMVKAGLGSAALIHFIVNLTA